MHVARHCVTACPRGLCKSTSVPLVRLANDCEGASQESSELILAEGRGYVLTAHLCSHWSFLFSCRPRRTIPIPCIVHARHVYAFLLPAVRPSHVFRCDQHRGCLDGSVTCSSRSPPRDPRRGWVVEDRMRDGEGRVCPEGDPMDLPFNTRMVQLRVSNPMEIERPIEPERRGRRSSGRGAHPHPPLQTRFGEDARWIGNGWHPPW